MIRAFGLRPMVMAGWTALLTAVRTTLDPRRYELVTLAAARALTSSYCILAHGGVLLKQGLTAAEAAAIASDAPDAPLTGQEREIMAYAAQIVRDATSVGKADVDRLRGTGLSDTEIFDIAATAAMRCFFRKLLAALGAEPDRAYAGLDPALRASLCVGRPVESYKRVAFPSGPNIPEGVRGRQRLTRPVPSMPRVYLRHAVHGGLGRNLLALSGTT